MSGRNIKVIGHALKPSNPMNRSRWECYCGANGVVLTCFKPASRERARRQEHDAHKIEVLRRQGKLEDEE